MSLLLSLSLAFGAEGMWLPEQLPALGDAMRSDGLQIAPDALAALDGAPLGAIVSLGFCSASFVSSTGLVVTNHHCAEGWLANLSTGERDHLNQGFTAAAQGEELWAGPSARMYVLESVSDRTEAVQARLEGVTDGAARQKAVDAFRAEAVAACEKQPGRRCRLAEFDGGRQYRLYQSLEIRDVRIVHAPPANIGFFGGDADNFEWPRHDGDYTFLRAYVGKNGKPADHSAKNVPYTPRHHLAVSATGVAPGDFVMVAGFPGSTDRHALAADLKQRATISLPDDLASAAAMEARLAAAIAADPTAEKYLASTRFGLENGRKYDEGIRDNLAASPILARKAEEEAKVEAWIAADPARAPFGESLKVLRDLLAKDAARYAQDSAIGELFQCTLLDVAHTAVRWHDERGKPDIEREAGTQDRDRPRLVAGMIELQEGYWAPFERAQCKAGLEAVLALPSDQAVAPVVQAVAAAGSVDALLDALFSADTLATVEGRKALFGEKPAAFAAQDPWFGLARALETEFLQARRRENKADAGVWRQHYPRWVDALVQARGGLTYPDANSTLRVTWGKVEGYPVRDGLVATPQTTVAGLLAKDATETYEAPAWEVEGAKTRLDSSWVDSRLRDVPVDFLSSVDTTGGNSGSATMNARGELVGLLFDGNYESMAADWLYDPTTTRSIHVDIRYVLWLMGLDPNTGWIRTELGVR
jgi:hypothetical protein